MSKERVKLEKLKEVLGDKKAVSAILAKVDSYIENLGDDESEDEKVKRFARGLIDRMHESRELSDREYMKVQANLVSLYSGQEFMKKKTNK